MAFRDSSVTVNIALVMEEGHKLIAPINDLFSFVKFVPF